MNYVVVGGGIGGLVAAFALRQKFPNSDVTLIERNTELGGLLAGVEYPDHGLYFDIGTHIFQEIGLPELDAILLSAAHKSDLLHFPVGEGDLAGVVFSGRLQENSYFPDLRGAMIDPDIAEAVRLHIGAKGDLPGIDRLKPALQTAIGRFGKVFTERVVAPTLARAFGCEAQHLAGFALELAGWSRVVLDDHAEWSKRITEERYRALVAVPDQRELPNSMHHGRRSFYSRHRGTRAFIDGISAGLRDKGVEFLCGATITSMKLDSRRINLIDQYGRERALTADGIVIATGVIGAAQLLGIDLASKGFDRPMPHWVMNIELEESCESDLCYVNGFDESCDWYRITNYRAFSGDNDDRRLTIEVVGRHDVDPLSWPKQLAAQLRSIGLIQSDEIGFADARKLSSGFPAPTLRNLQALAGLGAELNAAMPDGVILGGLGSRSGLFFQNEVVSDIYRRVSELA